MQAVMCTIFGEVLAHEYAKANAAKKAGSVKKITKIEIRN